MAPDRRHFQCIVDIAVARSEQDGHYGVEALCVTPARIGLHVFAIERLHQTPGGIAQQEYGRPDSLTRNWRFSLTRYRGKSGPAPRTVQAVAASRANSRRPSPHPVAGVVVVILTSKHGANRRQFCTISVAVLPGPAQANGQPTTANICTLCCLSSRVSMSQS